MRNNFFLFSLLFFLQIFVLNKVLFYKYIVLSPMLIILLLYNYQKNSKESLIVSFISGLLLDIFNDSLGVYIVTCIIVMYFRNFWVLKIIGEEKTEDISIMSVYELGNFQNLIYSFPLIILYFSILSLFESEFFFSVNNLLFILASSSANYVFILIFQYLFFENKVRDEWR
ncbi:MAG: hypothetical protein VXY09_02070 [Bacteroidota bacterium]|nr:hypothetical protein [Bacteroidota bacterium]